MRTVTTAGLIIKAAFTDNKRIPPVGTLTPLTSVGSLPSYERFHSTVARTESFSTTFIIPLERSGA